MYAFIFAESKQKAKLSKTSKKPTPQQKPPTPRVQKQKSTSQTQQASVSPNVQKPKHPAKELPVTGPCTPCQSNLDAALEHISDNVFQKVRLSSDQQNYNLLVSEGGGNCLEQNNGIT